MKRRRCIHGYQKCSEEYDQNVPADSNLCWASASKVTVSDVAAQISRYLVKIFAITKTRLFKYIENFTSKVFRREKHFFFFFFFFFFFSYFCSKHRLWVLVTTASASMLLSRNKNHNVYPCKPQFYSIKVGFKGVKII